MDAVSMRRSSTAVTGGTSALLSAPGAAVPSTEIGPPLSAAELLNSETVVALSAIILGLLSEVLSEDTIWLAMHRAAELAKGAGVSEEEFLRVKVELVKAWAVKKANNPMRSLF